MSTAARSPQAPEHTQDSSTRGPSLTDRMNMISRTYSNLIQNAIQAGHHEQVQVLMEQMKEEIDALVQAGGGEVHPITKKMPQPKKSMYDASLCGVDLDALVYDADRDTLEAMLADPTLRQLIDVALKETPPSSVRRDLLKRCLHLTPKLAPRLHALADDCRQTLGLKPVIEFYVYQDQVFNAALMPSSDPNTLIVMLSSGLIEGFDDDELKCVIGHEIGHFLFRHQSFPAHLLLEKHGAMISPIQAMKIYAWKRAAEISADRLSLLCARSYDACLRALFKSSSGISMTMQGYQINEFVNQLGELEAEMRESSADPSDWYTTHPFSPVRTKALEFFARSDTYHSSLGLQGGELSEAQLEDAIRKMMSLMEPAVLQSGDRSAEQIREFVFYAAVDIASADGKVTEDELQAMCELLQSDIDLGKIRAFVAQDGKARWEQVRKLAEDVHMSTSLAMRLNILRDLTVIARADGVVDEGELNALHDLCAVLGVREEFVDHVLDSVDQPLD